MQIVSTADSGDNCLKCQILFLGKNKKKYFKMSSAENFKISAGVLSVKKDVPYRTSSISLKIKVLFYKEVTILKIICWTFNPYPAE